MIIELKGVLSQEKVAEILADLDSQDFVDGRETAANAAGLVKRNIQLPTNSKLRMQIGKKIERSLLANRMFTWLVMPKRIGPFHLTRYEETHTYGDHVDNSIMGLAAGDPMRADISMTVFLNDPEDYDGGELVMSSRISPRRLKLRKGDAIIYPTGEFHRVEPVTRGVRIVAITWIQSIIRGAEQRQILADIWTAMDGVSRLTSEDKLGENVPYQTLSKSHFGLLRLWAET